MLCSKIYFRIKRGTLKTSLRVSCVSWRTVSIEYSFVCLLHTRSGSFLRGDLTISAEDLFSLISCFIYGLLLFFILHSSTSNSYLLLGVNCTSSVSLFDWLLEGLPGVRPITFEEAVWMAASYRLRLVQLS